MSNQVTALKVDMNRETDSAEELPFLDVDVRAKRSWTYRGGAILASVVVVGVVFLRSQQIGGQNMSDMEDVVGKLTEEQHTQLYKANWEGTDDDTMCVGINQYGIFVDDEDGDIGAAVTETEVDAYFAKGFNCFRVPVGAVYTDKLAAADKKFYDAIDHIVGLGAKAVVSYHSGGALKVADEIKFWEAIADHYKDETKVIFALHQERELEPTTEDASTTMDRYGTLIKEHFANCQTLIDKIRAKDSLNTILIPGLHDSSLIDWDGGFWWGENLDGTPNAGNSRLAALADPKNRIAYDVRAYFDEDVAGYKAGCIGHDYTSLCKKFPDCRGQDYALKRATEWARKYNKKLFLTEITSFPNVEISTTEKPEDTETRTATFNVPSNEECKEKMQAFIREVTASGAFLGYTVWPYDLESSSYDLSDTTLSWYNVGDDKTTKSSRQPRSIRLKEAREYCLTARDLGSSGVENAHLWKCDATDLKQKFVLPYYRTAGPIVWSARSNWCLDVDGGGTAMGTNIQLMECVHEHPNQQFILDDNSDLIRWATNPTLCVDPDDGSQGNGTNMQLWECDPRNTNQQWTYAGADLEPGTFHYSRSGAWYGEDESVGPLRFTSSIGWGSRPEKCFDVRKGETDLGTNLQIWRCESNHENQVFTLPHEGKSGPIIWTSHPTKCLDVAGGEDAEGTNIQIWDCELNHQNQHFTVPKWNATVPGVIRWTYNPLKCLDVQGGKDEYATNVQLYTCEDDHENQQFSVR